MNLTADGAALRRQADFLDELIENRGTFYETAVLITKAAGELRLASVLMTRASIAAHEHLELARAALDKVEREQTTEWVFELVAMTKAYIATTQRLWRGEVGQQN
jgi:hypothetical protein